MRTLPPAGRDLDDGPAPDPWVDSRVTRAVTLSAMDDDELMSIGRFAHLTDLTVHALRHYANVALLLPAQIDSSAPRCP